MIAHIELRNHEAQLLKEEEEKRLAEKKLRLEEEERKKFRESLYLKVYAQAYPDGILSCNVFLADPNGNTYPMVGGEFDYNVYDINGSIIRPYTNISVSALIDAIYVDIPLGRGPLRRAKFVEFEYINSRGETFKSSRTPIE